MLEGLIDDVKRLSAPILLKNAFALSGNITVPDDKKKAATPRLAGMVVLSSVMLKGKNKAKFKRQT